MNMFYDGGSFMGGMHWLWWMFGLALVGALVFWVLARSNERRSGPGEAPHEMLRRRLASGEITPAQYEERKALLDRDAGGKT